MEKKFTMKGRGFFAIIILRNIFQQFGIFLASTVLSGDQNAKKWEKESPPRHSEWNIMKIESKSQI